MRKLSREQLSVILMEEYINSHLEEDAVFSSLNIMEKVTWQNLNYQK